MKPPPAWASWSALLYLLLLFATVNGWFGEMLWRLLAVILVGELWPERGVA